MTLENIAKACNGIYVGDEDLKSKEITGVEKDSRLIEDGYLYLLCGSKSGWSRFYTTGF